MTIGNSVQIFGHTVKDIYNALFSHAHGGIAEEWNPKDRFRAYAQLGFSLIALCIGIFCLGSNDQTLQKFGIGLIGTAIAYWLR